MGGLFSSTPRPNGRRRETNCSVNENESNVVRLSFDAPNVKKAKHARFRWEPTGNGYIARFEALQRDGTTLYFDSPSTDPVPAEKFNRLGSPSLSQRGDFLVVTMSRPNDVKIERHIRG